MRTIKLDINCPICTQIIRVGQSDCCSECGWQPIIYAALPDVATESLWRKQLDAAKSGYEQIQTMQKEVIDFQKRITEIATIHQMLSVQYAELAPDYAALRKELEQVQNSYVVQNTSDLEEQINNLTFECNKLSAKVPSGYHRQQSPTFTFACRYNSEKNEVEAEIVEVPNHFSLINQEIVFAVAFFEKSQNYDLNEASVVIPTEAKIDVYFNKGDLLKFKLMYSPLAISNERSKYQVIHLTHNTINKFNIINEY